MSAQDSPSADQVREWIAAADREVGTLADQADEIQVRLAQARKRLVLYHEILASLVKAPVPVSDEVLRIHRSVKERTVEAAVEILREHGRPLRIQDIHAEFIRRGKPLPGRGTPTNIVAHLATAPEFERRGRGTYALAEWSNPVAPAADGAAAAPVTDPSVLSEERGGHA